MNQALRFNNKSGVKGVIGTTEIMFGNQLYPLIRKKIIWGAIAILMKLLKCENKPKKNIMENGHMTIQGIKRRAYNVEVWKEK